METDEERRVRRYGRRRQSIWLWIGVVVLIIVILFWLFSIGIIGDETGFFNG